MTGNTEAQFSAAAAAVVDGARAGQQPALKKPTEREFSSVLE
jgi:hypothetical protein